MKAFVSTVAKVSVLTMMMSAPISAQTNASHYEDDADFAKAPAAASQVKAWSAHSNDTATGTQTSFEECSVPGVCRSYTVTGGNFTAVITNLLTGKTIQVPMGQSFEAPVLYVKDGAIAAGIDYRIDADVGQWSHFCYPQEQTLKFVPADNNKEIKLSIPCE